MDDFSRLDFTLYTFTLIASASVYGVEIHVAISPRNSELSVRTSAAGNRISRICPSFTSESGHSLENLLKIAQTVGQSMAQVKHMA